MGINKRIELSWNGKPYPVNMTMRLIEHIEEKLNLGLMAQQCASGDIRFSHAARLVEIVLKDAGAEVTADEIYSGMFSGDDVSVSDVIEVVGLILSAVFPEPKKKAPSASKKPKRKT